MVKAIEQVRRDLATISERVVGVREALTSAYGDYLNCLGDSLKRQLVLASYQLCTQIYPQKFLQLSHSQRQALQQELRQLGIDLQTRLHTLLTDPEEQPSEAESEVMAEFFVDAGDMENTEDLDQELFEVFESLDQAIATDDQLEEKTDQADQLPPQLADKEKRRELSQLAERIADSLAEMMQGSPVEVSTDENSPDYWLEWCKTIEKRIRRTLNQTSQAVNHQLQDAKILPENIPTTVLDMAIQADNQQHGGQMPSHLVNVVIEAELGKKKKKRKHRTHLTAVHLKVSEVEFTEPGVSAQRRRLREQVDKLRNLQKYYQKAKQDLAIAEAEAAWRASWYENP
ncbi:hypothetical protein AWQ21_10685 [Picosynechococcus sp. PCC 7003]|uniref:hypothetical protein n=1 Tax=Picosynechococcus sp. PCC 7003 TaxID=374981 RepID=UPI00081071E3|nr:hypothetical protein [Picosynechococcus sp. PCC 7003]ANV84804.1 hypothetical protein AWQ21_10685 [Picosynechococcus sp. PCC 7003]